MANFAFSALLAWSRLLVQVLQMQWEDSAPLKKTKIYHWYVFTNGMIHNWSCFTAQSVEALFQTSAPQLRLPFLGTSVTARHRAVLTFALVVLVFACTKSECVADIDLPRTWNARGLTSRESIHFRASFFPPCKAHRPTVMRPAE